MAFAELANTEAPDASYGAGRNTFGATARVPQSYANRWLAGSPEQPYCPEPKERTWATLMQHGSM